MRKEGDLIKIREWLLPISWIYGFAVWVRNRLFDIGILKSRSFDIPIISVGNITVGGSGKTPHVEYIINLLHKKVKVAMLSRGYKRKTSGLVLASRNTTMTDIGDEPFQIKTKFKDIYVAVDKKRTRAIDFLITNTETNDVDVILLDDAFQHRYVKPGINILLVDYHRLINYDKLLPAGCLREPKEGKSRADIVIISKCPGDLKPMEYRVLTKAMNLYPYQSLFFTSLEYGELCGIFSNKFIKLTDLSKEVNILLLTGIASPKQLKHDLKKYSNNILPITFKDHHMFTKTDIKKINNMFNKIKTPKIIITTEKDKVRLQNISTLSDDVKNKLYYLPIKVKFMLDQEDIFNEKIISYVQKNSRNSILVKRKDDNNSSNCNNIRNRTRTISFRDN